MLFLDKSFSFLKEEGVVGLDIGEDYITAARLFLEKDGGIKIKSLGWVKNKHKASNRYTAGLIKKLWRMHRLKSRTVSFSLRSPSLVTRYFKYPDLSKQELKSTIQLEAEQIFQRPKGELFIDWYLYPQALASHKGMSNGIKEGILVAIPREDVEKNLVILEMAGLYPIILDISSMAISRLFLRLKGPCKDKAICLVNLTSYNVDFSILSEGPHIYPKNIYSQAIPWEERRSDLIEVLKDILRYYQFRLHRPPVERLVFTGQFSFNEGFQEEIKKSIDLPIEFWNPLKEIAFKNDITGKEIEAYGPITATSLGLAMQRAT